MKIFNSYILKNLALATFFIAVILVFIIFLTQSLRFLEVIINAGSSGSSFFVLTALALPRFFEIILPISIMAATLFLYNKMIMDSEMVAMRATGHSPIGLAQPALILGVGITIMLWGITMWVAPASLAKMQKMQHALKSEFSTLLIKEGVFNQIGRGLTVYIHERAGEDELAGLMIHDTRDEGAPPSTVLARRGMIVSSAEGQQVVVFDGARQSYDPKTGILQKLAFDRYTIDLPNSAPVATRWAQPDERTLMHLLHPDLNNDRDLENLHAFAIEIHRRFTSPLLALCFPMIALAALLLGPSNRRGQGLRIAAAVILIIVVQGGFLAAYNLARNHVIGLFLMYGLTLLPIGLSLFFLSPFAESLRRKIFYNKRSEMEAPA